MNRRKTIKSLLAGSIAGGAVISGCQTERSPKLPPGKIVDLPDYGRTEKEKEIDRKLLGEQFFSDHELDTISVLCDLILPGTDGYRSTSDAEVSQFIEFIAKDIPKHQLPLRGGIMWIDNFARENYNNEFSSLSTNQQKSLLDQIAYPDDAKPDLSQGVSFFTLVRNLTLTGFYTSKIGIEELGYEGNTPNIWDGVPEEELKAHGLSYDSEWLSKCVDQSKRDVMAQWDENGNLQS